MVKPGTSELAPTSRRVASRDARNNLKAIGVLAAIVASLAFVLWPRPLSLDVRCASVVPGDDTGLTVTVVSGPTTFGERVEVREYSDKVILRGAGYMLPGPTTAEGVPKPLTVTLGSPLGSRTLLADGPPAWPDPTPLGACR